MAPGFFFYFTTQLNLGGNLAFDAGQLYAVNLLWWLKSGKDILSLWKKKFGKDPVSWLQQGIRQFESQKTGCSGYRSKESPRLECEPCKQQYSALDLTVDPDGTIRWGIAY